MRSSCLRYLQPCHCDNSFVILVDYGASRPSLGGAFAGARFSLRKSSNRCVFLFIHSKELFEVAHLHLLCICFARSNRQDILEDLEAIDESELILPPSTSATLGSFEIKSLKIQSREQKKGIRHRGVKPMHLGTRAQSLATGNRRNDRYIPV